MNRISWARAREIALEAHRKAEEARERDLAYDNALAALSEAQGYEDTYNPLAKPQSAPAPATQAPRAGSALTCEPVASIPLKVEWPSALTEGEG